MGEGTYRLEEEGVLLDFLMAPWAMVRWGLWVWYWLLVFAQRVTRVVRLTCGVCGISGCSYSALCKQGTLY